MFEHVPDSILGNVDEDMSLAIASSLADNRVLCCKAGLAAT